MKVTTVVTVLMVSFSVVADAQEYCSYYGDVRLAGGSNEWTGRVEVCIGRAWGTVCQYSYLSHADTRVVCRQLGYEVDIQGAHFYRYRHGGGTGSIFLDNVRCTGRESSLLDCQYNWGREVGNVYPCPHSYDVGVRCPSNNCNHGNVRLAGGLEPTEGRVELCVRGRWSAVCHSQWNYQDAYVVCRQLDYPATGAVPYSSSSSRFGKGVHANLANFRCYGNETHLVNCTHTASSCSRDYTAGVRCYGDVVSGSPQCFGNGNIRLVGGADANEGRVEVCVNGMWGTVCGDGWDSRDATVVCKQLGYQNPYVYTYSSSSVFGAGSGPILFSDLNCDGSESTLLECSNYSPYYCSHSQDAGVQCEHRLYSGCTYGTIQLAGGQSNGTGRVEICINGVWGSVCDDGWSSNDARVVCRMLGLPDDAGASAYSNANFGSSSGPYHLDDVYCRGSETSLFSCNLYAGIGVHNCRPGNEAGVKCVALPTCIHHGDVRLVGGETSYEGGVEICLNNYWVPVCDSGWNELDSTVVCRQVTGMQNPWSSAIRRASYAYATIGRSNIPPYFTQPSCSGLENQLLSCTYSATFCTHYDDVGVRCYFNTGCAEGGVRLVGGETEMEGIVEVCYNQVWWAVDDSYWDFNDATVVCRHLHYPSNWAIPLSTAYFGRGNATILVRDFRCAGHENSLDECAPSNYSIPSTYYGWQIRNRGHVASVICHGNTTIQSECSSGDFRLVGGERESEVRVEICVDGFWGTVCDSGWRREEAMVVCRQLNMQISGAFPITGAYFGEGTGPVLSGINCVGTEDNVSECGVGSVGQLNCHHGRDAGVICQDAKTVTVVTHPPNGPHLIGSTVNLTCHVQPQPLEEEVTYRWRDYVPYTYPVVANSSLPYATLTIGIGHPHTARYYCQVYYRNVLLATGSTVISVQGLLYPLGPTLVQYTVHEVVTLRVNITPTANLTRDYLRLLTWYYNGAEIIPASGGSISLRSNNDHTTLTIANISESHSGVYEVKFAGLSIYPHNNCQKETLAMLRHYPVLSPVVFHVYSDELPSTDEEASVRGHIRADPSSGFLPFTSSDSITVSIDGDAPTTQRDLVYTSWYFNGLRSYQFVSSLLKLPTGVTQSLTIDNPTPLHAGTYETLLLLNPSSYLQQFGCPNEYPNFISNSDQAGVYTIIVDKTVVDLMYYEPAAVSIWSDKQALHENENTTLTCMAGGGYPPANNISWVKNGRIISTTSTQQLTISVTAGQHSFGRYVCLVNNSAVIQQQSLLMKQKGELQVKVDLYTFGGCSTFNNDTQQMLKTGVADAILESCSCNFTSSDLELSEATCSGDGNTLTLTTTIAYASESGNQTASTLIQMFQGRVASTNTVISIGSQNVTVTNVCSPTCIPEPEEGEPTSSAAAVGVGTYLGGLLTGIILTIAVVTIRVVVKRRTPTSKTTETSTKATAATTDKEMVRYESGMVQMGPNISYEEVEYPEEAIYEHPN